MGARCAAFSSPLHTFHDRITFFPHRHQCSQKESSTLSAQSRRLKFPSMCSSQTPPDEKPMDDRSARKKPYYLTMENGNLLLDHSMAVANNDIHSVAKKCAAGFVDAFVQCYDVEEYLTVFTVVGHGFNGLVGLYTAIQLKARGYSPVVYSSYPSKYVDLESVCAENGIKFSDFVPSTLSFYFDVVIDALLGTGFDGGDIHQQYWTVYEMLTSIDLPIISVDAPSGWDLSLGPREIDIMADTYVKPDVLVSLGAPKLCARAFTGMFHFVVTGLVSPEWLGERDVELPTPLEGRSNTVLLSSTAKPFGKNPGEVYSRPGTFDATLFTKNPRREWVDVEEHDELWDELD